MKPNMDPQKIQRWLQIVQLIVTLALVPAVRWGFLISERQQAQEMQLLELRGRLEGEQRAVVTLVDELRGVRASIDGMKTELLQRLTRVETRIDAQRETNR